MWLIALSARRIPLKDLKRIDEVVETATRRIKFSLGVEEIHILDALNRIIAEDYYARLDRPRYDRSSVDGYAVRSVDVVGASPFNPVILRVKGVLTAADTPEKYAVGEGEAVEVFTGAPIPPGADAVVMVEYTKRIGNEIEIYKPVRFHGNVSRHGEDFKKGDLLVKKNTLLRPWHIAVIAANGDDKVRVYEKLRIGVISTGSEVVEPGHELGEGGLYNSTAYLVTSYLRDMGFTSVRYYGNFPDEKEVIREAILHALEENHVVVTIGGTSMGGTDYVKDVVMEMGEWIARGVAMRPGRPTSIGLIDGKPVFLLSGYPVAAWTGLEALVRPILYRSLGLREPPRPVIRGRLLVKIPNTVGYRSYIRVMVEKRDDGYVVEPFMLKGSGILSSLVKSNGYIVIPEDTEGYSEGEEVEVHLLV